MLVTLEEIKQYLKIDYLEDSDTRELEEIILPAAENFVREGVTDLDLKASNPNLLPQIKLAIGLVASEMYENRTMIDTRGSYSYVKNAQPSFMVQALLNQIEYGGGKDV